jgi:hypothetical protein
MKNRTGSDTWLLLLHQIPPSPPYLRAKILRRLKQAGALPLKKSAYLLPDTEEAIEDFQWLLKEIGSEKGEGWILRVEALAGLTDDSIRQAFRDLRSSDYRELLSEAQALAEQFRTGDGNGAPSPDSGWRKLRKRCEEVQKIDFFEASGKREVMDQMNEIEQSLKRSAAAAGAAAESPASGYKGRTWVTRRGIKVDRTACAWLIKRFIDPEPEFAFENPDQYVHRPGELRFDMYEGEFTHEGGACTFEVLLARCGPTDPALRAIGEIVHDLDLKETKFDRPETAGIAALIDGLALRHADDARRMEEGFVIFDALYARLRVHA